MWMIKFLHTRIRVSNPEASIAFYQKIGFELGEQKTSPQGNQLVFLHLDYIPIKLLVDLLLCLMHFLITVNKSHHKK